MKKKLRCFTVVLLLYIAENSCLYSVNNLRLPDIRSMGTGGNGVTQSLLFNPALVAEKYSRSIYVQYYNRYGLSELGTVSVGCLYPNHYLPMAVHISSFGYDAYRESMFQFSVSKRLSERWSIGVAVQYIILQTDLYIDKTPSWLATDVGIIYHPTENLLFGISLLNTPTLSFGNKTAEHTDHIPYSLQIGLQWNIIENMLLIGSLETTKENYLSADIGMEYTLFDFFYLRAGFRTSPFIPCLGIGYTYSAFQLDTVVNWDTVLGVSTGIGLTFTF